MDKVRDYLKTNFGTWPLPLWVQVTINFALAYSLAICLAVYAKDFPSNPTYILLSAVVIYDGTRGTIKTGVQRLLGTLVGIGVGAGTPFVLNLMPPAEPFLYTWKPIVLGIIIAPITGLFIGWSKGQKGLMQYNWYFFKYCGITICLGSMFVIDTSTGELNIEYAKSRVIGIALGVTLGSLLSLWMGAPSRRIFRNSLAVIATRVATLVEVTLDGFYVPASGGSLYEKGREQAGPLGDAIMATTNILSETNTPTLSGLVFRKGGRTRYQLALKRLQRCRHHAMHMLLERAEVVDSEKADKTSLEFHQAPMDIMAPPEDFIDHVYYPSDMKPLARGFTRYLEPGAASELSTALVDILAKHGPNDQVEHPADPQLLRDIGMQISSTLRKCADSLKSFPLNLHDNKTFRAADIFMEIEASMTSVLERAYVERAKLELVMALSFEDGIPWPILLQEVKHTTFYEAIVLQEYRLVLVRFLRLGFETLEFANLLYNQILVPH